MQNKFCKALSNALSFRIPDNSNSVTFNPCCLYDDYLPFHPTVFKKTRESLIAATDFPDACSKCKLKEKTHGTSHRIGNNASIPDGIDDSIWKLEIALDTTCNAACIQCGPLQSSLWRKLEDDARPSANRIFHIQPVSQIEDNIDRIFNTVDLSKVKRIHFWGGEPLLTDTHTMVLERFGDLSDIELIYTSNLSIFPKDKVLNLWSKCKKVFVGLSVDGIDEQFEFIRWPLGWKKATENMKLFRENSPANLVISINTCILPLNVLHAKTLEEWLEANFSSTVSGKKIIQRYIRGEGTLDTAVAPQALREKVFEVYAEDHPIYRVLKEVDIQDPTYMVGYLDMWDSRRKTNWRETFADVQQFF
jgi:sulfatase maturation enzyme AslB (radical SAM superfamily)